MRTRLLLGPVMLLALLGVLWLDETLGHAPLPAWLADRIMGHRGAEAHVPPGALLLVIGVLLVPLAARELGAMFKAGSVRASRWIMSVGGIAGLLVSATAPAAGSPARAVALVASVGALVLVCALLWHVRDRQTSGAAAAVGAAMMAFVYLGLMFGFVIALRNEHSAWVVLGVIVVVKSCDIGAYFVGKAMGRRKLIPWLSPGKTWEGLIGGLATSALVAWGLAGLSDGIAGTEGAWMLRHGWTAALGGVVLGLVGQAGDLLESALKRGAGVKDSGRAIPGFGGVLDVLDSVLLTAPVAYWLLAAG